MKTLAILSRKGGSGKSTFAVHLAVAAERAGHTTALIDLDPQAAEETARSKSRLKPSHRKSKRSSNSGLSVLDPHTFPVTLQNCLI